ncbi:MAG: hypothetical protein HUU55_23840 [Myxococcales bacterium]|nr:hypothetical protein [Myxococcales bacterium]
MKLNWKSCVNASRKLSAVAAIVVLVGFNAVACDVEDDSEGDATATGDTDNGGDTLVQACQEWVACCVAASPGRANAQANCEAGAKTDYKNSAELCNSAKVDFPGCQ